MNLNITWQQLSFITGGKLASGNKTALFNSFETDSRKIVPNSNFWVLKGEKHDAHDFLPEVIAKGAQGVIVEYGRLSSSEKLPPHVLEVENTLKALQKLAAWHKARISPKTVCITGTNGKSTSKQMMKAVMELNGQTCANKGNLNNQYGLPLSLLELKEGDKYAVFELGASRKGDIFEIGELAVPEVGIITNVAPAHLEFFGDMETVYKTKSEMKDVLKKDGVLVYNIDNSYLKRLKNDYCGKALTFGFSDEADFRVITETGPLKIKHGDIIYEIASDLPLHNRLNACAVAAAAYAMGFSKESIENGIAAFEPMPMRMSVTTANNNDYILDAYNANPLSMQAALEFLARSPRKCKAAVLGDMKELGRYSKQMHRELGVTI